MGNGICQSQNNQDQSELILYKKHKIVVNAQTYSPAKPQMSTQNLINFVVNEELESDNFDIKITSDSKDYKNLEIDLSVSKHSKLSETQSPTKIRKKSIQDKENDVRIFWYLLQSDIQDIFGEELSIILSSQKFNRGEQVESDQDISNDELDEAIIIGKELKSILKSTGTVSTDSRSQSKKQVRFGLVKRRYF